MKNQDMLLETQNESAAYLEQQCEEYVKAYAEYQTDKDRIKKEFDKLKKSEKINTVPESDGEEFKKHLASKKKKMQKKTGQTIIGGLVALIFLVTFTFLFKILGIFENVSYTNWFWLGTLGIWIVGGAALSWLASIIVLIFIMKKDYRVRATLEKIRYGLLVGIVVLISIAGGISVNLKWNIGYSVPVQGGSLGKSSEWGFALGAAAILAILSALAVFFCISKENQKLKVIMLLQTFEDTIEKKISEKLRGYDVDIKKVKAYCELKEEEKVILQKWENDVYKCFESRLGKTDDAIREAKKETPGMPATIYIAELPLENQMKELYKKVEKLEYNHKAIVFLFDKSQEDGIEDTKKFKILPDFVTFVINSFSAFNRGNLEARIMLYYGDSSIYKKYNLKNEENPKETIFKLYHKKEECEECIKELDKFVKKNVDAKKGVIEEFNKSNKDSMIKFQLVNIILNPSDSSFLNVIKDHEDVFSDSYNKGILPIYFVAKQAWEEKKEYAEKMGKKNVWYLGKKENKIDLIKYEENKKGKKGHGK